MSKREPVYAVRTSDGICGAIYCCRAEAESAVKAAASFGIDACVVELVEVVRCGECRQWVSEPTEAGYGHCVTEGYIKADWYCPNGSRR